MSSSTSNSTATATPTDFPLTPAAIDTSATTSTTHTDAHTPSFDTSAIFSFIRDACLDHTNPKFSKLHHSDLSDFLKSPTPDHISSFLASFFPHSSSKYSLLRTFASIVSHTHHAHYQTSPTGLLDLSESPGHNTIWKLYNDGEITYEKGGYAYQRRNLFTWSHPIIYSPQHISFSLPVNISSSSHLSYAILTMEQAVFFRALFKHIISMP